MRLPVYGAPYPEDPEGSLRASPPLTRAGASGSVTVYLTVEGGATCDVSRVRIRLYEGEGDKPKFIGTAEGSIEGHQFKASGQKILHPRRCPSSTASNGGKAERIGMVPVNN